MDIRKLPADRGHGFFRLLFCVYTPLLFLFTLLPIDLIQSESPGWFEKFSFENQDKLVHFLLFFIFTLLFFFSAFTKRNFLIWLVPLLTGILIEILQQLTGWGRTFDVFDILANAVGIFAAWLSVKKL
ncbi:MAG: VanZ family protein [Flavobacteriia bacterium]|nr:VanZ family protein [Flavobacteriia bacterium]